MPSDRSEYMREYAAKNRARRRENRRAKLGIDPDEKDGFVYFYLCTLTSKVKVGFTTDPASRLKMLNLGRPVDLEELALIPGTQRVNKAWQDELAEASEYNRSGWYPASVVTPLIARELKKGSG